jgi:hypothetical protein
MNRKHWKCWNLYKKKRSIGNQLELLIAEKIAIKIRKILTLMRLKAWKYRQMIAGSIFMKGSSKISLILFHFIWFSYEDNQGKLGMKHKTSIKLQRCQWRTSYIPSCLC